MQMMYNSFYTENKKYCFFNLCLINIKQRKVEIIKQEKKSQKSIKKFVTLRELRRKKGRITKNKVSSEKKRKKKEGNVHLDKGKKKLGKYRKTCRRLLEQHSQIKGKYEAVNDSLYSIYVCTLLYGTGTLSTHVGLFHLSNLKILKWRGRNVK